MSARRAPLSKHLKMLGRARCRFAVSSRIREVRENRCGVSGAIQGRDAPKMGMPAVEMDVSLIFFLTRFLICGNGPGRHPKPLTDFAGRFGRFRA